MKSTIIKLEKKVSQICEYLLLWKKVQSDISSLQVDQQQELPESLQKILRNPDKKIFDYKLSILILYGAFENYIESIVSQYVLKLNAAVDSFSNLPKQIQSRHTELSAKLISFICAGYGKYEQIDTADVIKHLYSCYVTPQNYQLNIAAFTQHSSNFRINTIRELFAGIGISAIDTAISNDSKFVAFLQGVNPEFSIIAESKNAAFYHEKCFQLLDDLVERRNDIAHGVDDADDNILSTDVLIDYANYIVAFSNAIYSIVLKEYTKTTVLSQGKNILCLGKPIKVFDNCIVCFNNKYNKISVGDTIAGINTCEKIRVGHIESLQIDQKSTDCISPEISVNFGAKVNFHASANYNYYIIK